MTDDATKSGVTERMEAIRRTGPSWKTDVVLRCHCYGPGFRHWSANCNDIWGHMHSLVFYGATPERALEGLEQYMREITTQGIDDVPWQDDDGVVRGPGAYRGQPTDMGEFYMDEEPTNAKR